MKVVDLHRERILRDLLLLDLIGMRFSALFNEEPDAGDLQAQLLGMPSFLLLLGVNTGNTKMAFGSAVMRMYDYGVGLEGHADDFKMVDWTVLAAVADFLTILRAAAHHTSKLTLQEGRAIDRVWSTCVAASGRMAAEGGPPFVYSDPTLLSLPE
jgi:hypothetical protein